MDAFALATVTMIAVAFFWLGQSEVMDILKERKRRQKILEDSWQNRRVEHE